MKINILFYLILLFALNVEGQIYVPGGVTNIFPTTGTSTLNIGINNSDPQNTLDITGNLGENYISLYGSTNNGIKFPSGSLYSSYTNISRGARDTLLFLDNGKKQMVIGKSEGVIFFGKQLFYGYERFYGQFNFTGLSHMDKLIVTSHNMSYGPNQDYKLPVDYSFGVNVKSHFNEFVAIGDTCIPTDPRLAPYKLAVSGGILTEKLTVKRIGNCWADYVFDKNYKLRSLYDVEKFIHQNRHLPEIPSAMEVEKEGLEVSEMMKLQMQKIEELTLYMIEMQKQQDQLKEENKFLKSEIEKLREIR